ncbi:MAG: hypothetical protein EOP48_28115, partial [Sphingobacteriales bacterium]
MKRSFLLILAYAALCCYGQADNYRDSLYNVQFEEMRTFFMKVETADIPYSEKAELTYNKVKAFLQANPAKPDF